MSYLLDKKIKRKKISQVIIGIILLVALFYFRTAIWSGLSFVSENSFHPVFVLGKNVGEKMGSISSYFVSKNSLYLENENLKSQILESQADRSNYASVVAENVSLQGILDRKDPKINLVLSAILAKPNQSPYDTLIIDVGSNQGIKTGNIVFALGNVPIGRIYDVYQNSSRVILFSNPGETTQAILPNKNVLPTGQQNGNVFMQLVGRGGGNFEIIMPKDFVLQVGDTVVLPGINPHVLAIVEKIISDPRSPFTKALLVSPVNIQELKFVEVEK